MWRTSATLAIALCFTVSFTDTASGGGYPAVANRPAFVAVGDGLTESAFSNEHNGWGLLMQMKYTRKASAPCPFGAPELRYHNQEYVCAAVQAGVGPAAR